MYLIHEDLARAHIRARVESARKRRRAAQLARVRRLNHRAQEAALEARLLRDRFN